MKRSENIIESIFASQGPNGCWKMLEENNRNYPACLHYSPTFKSTVWTLILLADLEHDRDDERVKLPLGTIQEHFYDSNFGIYSLGRDHFPVPCLNGNMIYLDAYFNRTLSAKSVSAVNFFCEFQRFDDGVYQEPRNQFCGNTSCFGKHTCYWGIVKLLKGLSFVPEQNRTVPIKKLLRRCIGFVLLHQVCFSSHNEGKYLSGNIDKLGFPCMYQSNFLEILWLLKRESVDSEEVSRALQILKQKQQPERNWKLEKKVSNMVVSVGAENNPNEYITKRAIEVLEFYQL